MKMPKGRALALLLLGVLAFPAVAQTDADSYPSRPMRIVAPFAAGGSADILARLIGQYFTEKTGQTIVIENKPGANSVIGVMAARAAPADGYTLLLATTTSHAANPGLFKALPYDPLKDFTMVGIFGMAGSVLLALPDAPYKNLREFVDYAKAYPGKLNYGQFNASSHVPAAALGKCAGLDYTAVAYKNVGTAVTDLYGGRLDFLILDTAAAEQYLGSGKMRAIAVTHPKRYAKLPDVAAVSEVCPGFEAVGFLGLAVPAATPRTIALKLNKLMDEAVFSPALRPRLDEFGLVPQHDTLESVRATVAHNQEVWVDYIKAAGIEPQ